MFTKTGMRAVAAATALALTVGAHAGTAVEYVFVIDGVQSGTGSAGSGYGRVTLDTNTNTMGWEIAYSGLSGPATAAHFHGPALPGQGAGVQVNIGTANPAAGTAPLTAAQAADLQAGLWYVNIHSGQFPGGEIRGQVVDGAVRINEIRIDQGGADDDEYFELDGPGGSSLDTLTYIVIGDGTGGSGVIDAVVPLAGTIMPASGFFVAAESTFSLGVPDLVTSLNFENSDNVTHMLVVNFTGAAGDDLDTDDDCMLDVTPWDLSLDSIALVETPDAGDCFYGPSTIGPDGIFVPGHAYRCTPNDIWVAGEFGLGIDDTPGAANAACPPVGECPGVGDCCAPNATPGCDDVECCTLVCQIDPSCCDLEWDTICALTAEKNCEPCFPVPPCPGEGDCCSDNGTPGCDDLECCEAVCAVDPFCCDVAWNQFCADAAADICPACQPTSCCDGSENPEGEPCGADNNGGCNSTPQLYVEGNCGQTYCGTAWADGGTRDTDWYIVNLAAGTTITGRLESEFPGAVFIVDGIASCTPVVIGDIGCGDACASLAVASATVAADGDYVVFVSVGNCDGSGIFQGFPCDTLNDYRLIIDCLLPPPPVIINEIRIDQVGSDNDEYFELKGPPGTSLDGVTYLVIGDGTVASGVVEAAVDLTGSSIGATGLFVAAEATFTLGVPDLVTSISFENSDNLTHILVTGFSGSVGDDLDVDDDCVLDATPWAVELDRIAQIEEDNPPVNTECHYGPPTIGPDGTFVPGHIYRCEPDGTWTIGVFDPIGVSDTPGAPNLPCGDGCNPTCPADTDNDGEVGVTDLVNVVLCWGTDGTGDCNCTDVDGDGSVGVNDLVEVILNWGPCP